MPFLDYSCLNNFDWIVNNIWWINFNYFQTNLSLQYSLLPKEIGLNFRRLCLRFLFNYNKKNYNGENILSLYSSVKDRFLWQWHVFCKLEQNDYLISDSVPWRFFVHFSKREHRQTTWFCNKPFSPFWWVRLESHSSIHPPTQWQIVVTTPCEAQKSASLMNAAANNLEAIVISSTTGMRQRAFIEKQFLAENAFGAIPAAAALAAPREGCFWVELPPRVHECECVGCTLLARSYFPRRQSGGVLGLAGSIDRPLPCLCLPAAGEPTNETGLDSLTKRESSS